MFKITDNKGFHMTFANGWTVSVQFGYGNYSDNYNSGRYGEPADPSCNAEVAAWDGEGKWYQVDGDEVQGHQTPDQVADLIEIIRRKP